jgi:thiol-disulfide isomerase/thioredoxin
MRMLLIIGGWYFAASCFLTGAADAASIEGRVVDSSGQPMAGAVVWIWQKLPAAVGRGVSDQQVKLDDSDVLVTDAEGRFTAPNVLVGEAFARIVVEADGFLAGRSGWIEVSETATADAGDIVLKRLVTVVGRVRDRQNRPIADATVFNCDGHQRVETKTDAAGEFRLPGVPEGGVFVFAEKPGYRFSGVHLSAEQAEGTLTLTSVDEAVKPLPTLPPLLSDEEEDVLARQVAGPWLGELAKSGTEREKLWALACLVDLDPLEAFDRAREFDFADPRRRDLAESLLVEKCIAWRGSLGWDELRTLIEAGTNPLGITYEFVEAAKHMDDGEQARKRDWIAQALLHARRVDAPVERPRALAWVADGLFAVGEREQAERIVCEAEALVERLPHDPVQLRDTFRILALAVARSDSDRAMAWLEKYDDTYWYQEAGGQLAVKLLPDHPAAAEEIWHRTVERNRGREQRVFSCWRYGQIADLCYGLARIDRDRAQRIAETAENHPLRVRAFAAIALALAESDPPAARDLLKTVVRDELPQPGADDGSWYDSLSPSVTAAWLLPIAEKVAPELGRECLWRSLAMRLPRPRRDRLDGGDVQAELATVKMLARYDRALARTLLEPIAARLPELAGPALTRLEPNHGRLILFQAIGLANDVVSAAVHVDPRWAVELLDHLPQGEGAPHRQLHNEVRGALIGTLGRHGADRWEECDAFCASFWKPIPALAATQPAKGSTDEPAGIGVALATEDDQIVVGRVLPDTPAAQSRAIHEGDRILAVGQGDDAPVETKGRRIEDVVALIRGKRGSLVRLTIVPAGKPNDRAVVVTLTRGTVKGLNLLGKGEAIKVGSPAPPLAYSRLDSDDKHQLADLKGKVVVLTFWASWCGPCKKVVDELFELPSKNPAWGDRVVMLALSVDEDKEAARKVLLERGWEKGRVGWCGPDALKIFDIRALPATFVSDSDGKVVALGEVDVAEAVNKRVER